MAAEIIKHNLSKDEAFKLARKAVMDMPMGIMSSKDYKLIVGAPAMPVTIVVKDDSFEVTAALAGAVVKAGVIEAIKMKLEDLETQPSVANNQPVSSNITTQPTTMVNTAENRNMISKENPLEKRILFLLEDGFFDKAGDYCEKLIDEEPGNPMGYLFKLMIANSISRMEDIPEFYKTNLEELNNNSFFKRFCNCASVEKKNNILGISYVMKEDVSNTGFVQNQQMESSYEVTNSRQNNNRQPDLISKDSLTNNDNIEKSNDCKEIDDKLTEKVNDTTDLFETNTIQSEDKIERKIENCNSISNKKQTILSFVLISLGLIYSFFSYTVYGDTVDIFSIAMILATSVLLYVIKEKQEIILMPIIFYQLLMSKNAINNLFTGYYHLEINSSTLGIGALFLSLLVFVVVAANLNKVFWVISSIMLVLTQVISDFLLLKAWCGSSLLIFESRLWIPYLVKNIFIIVALLAVVLSKKKKNFNVKEI